MIQRPSDWIVAMCPADHPDLSVSDLPKSTVASHGHLRRACWCGVAAPVAVMFELEPIPPLSNNRNDAATLANPS
jgi:hypothetical protein